MGGKALHTLFLTLNTHAGNGGIEKFNRSLIAALDHQKRICNIALHDPVKLNSTKNHRGYSGKILGFAWAFFLQCFNSKQIIVGHLNLASIALLGSLFFQRKRLFLVVHGLELWLPLGIFKKLLLNRVHQCITVSAYSAKRLTEIGVQEKRIRILHNTLGINNYQIVHSQQAFEQWKTKYAATQDSFIILTTARMQASEAYKGYDRVIQALPEILKSIPNVHYVLVGKYDALEKRRLDHLIQQNQLEDHVTFTGFVSDEELGMWMTKANLFIMPSTMEGFGIVYIEAMACGTPVIAGNKDGSVDALAGGELGTLIDPESIDEIGKAVIHIHDNYYHVLKGEALQEAVIKKFGFEVFSKRVQEIFT